MRREPGRAHVDFMAPVDAYRKALAKNARITTPPDDGMSHPATGVPCRSCQSMRDREVADPLGERIADHLKVFSDAQKANNALLAELSAELQRLIDEATKAGRADLLGGLRGAGE